MPVALACTWVPRGETLRLERIRPLLADTYAHLVIALPPDRDPAGAGPLRDSPNATLVITPQPYWGRYVAVQRCVELPVSHIHYADLDMLVRWIEDRPDEWRQTVRRISEHDCLITGRTDRAFTTRPQAIQQSERIINAVGSHLLGQAVDLGLGSRGYSVRAARAVLANSRPGGFGDLEWPILVRRAGHPVAYLEVDGVDWETPDQYRAEPADPATRQEVADRYDQRADRWALRVRVAREIIEEGLAAMNRPMVAADDANAPSDRSGP
jgi:hypothetical protein